METCYLHKGPLQTKQQLKRTILKFIATTVNIKRSIAEYNKLEDVWLNTGFSFLLVSVSLVMKGKQEKHAQQLKMTVNIIFNNFYI